MAKFATNASGAIWWPNLVQVTESISGSVVPLAMFFQLVQCYPTIFQSFKFVDVLAQLVTKVSSELFIMFDESHLALMS